MRQRQACCMHGGYRKYRGGGVTIDWNTTLNNNPEPEPEPEPIPDPVIPVKPIIIKQQNNIDGYIAGLVGLGTLSAGLFGSTMYYRRKANARDINDEPVYADYAIPGYDLHAGDEEDEVPLLKDERECCPELRFRGGIVPEDVVLGNIPEDQGPIVKHNRLGRADPGIS